MRHRFFAEFLGTFILVFAGTGAIVVDGITGGVIGHAGIALTFGLVVGAMIYTFGDVSGAHLNPAVSVAFVVSGRFPASDLVAYVTAQILGAVAAIAIGSVVGLEAMFAGPICGASMNPARSLGPALVSGNLDHIWLYPVATTLGAILAIPFFKLTSKPENTP